MLELHVLEYTGLYAWVVVYMLVSCRILWSIPFYCIWQQDGDVKHIGSIIAGNHSGVDAKAKMSFTRQHME